MLLKVITDIVETYGLNMKRNIMALILEILSENRNDRNMIIGAKCRRNIIGMSFNTHYEKIYSLNIIRIIGPILLQ